MILAISVTVFITMSYNRLAAAAVDIGGKTPSSSDDVINRVIPIPVFGRAAIHARTCMYMHVHAHTCTYVHVPKCMHMFTNNVIVCT